MVKRNYLKLILAVTIFFTTAIIAAISLNAEVPDVNFNNAVEFVWDDVAGETSDYWNLVVFEIDSFPKNVPAIAEYTNPNDMKEIVAYNGVNAVYFEHSESYLYWVFDGVNEVVDFYNYKFHKKETVAYADLIDVVIYDNPLAEYINGYNEARGEYAIFINNEWVNAVAYGELQYNEARDEYGVFINGEWMKAIAYGELQYNEARDEYGVFINGEWMKAIAYGDIKYNDGYDQGVEAGYVEVNSSLEFNVIDFMTNEVDVDVEAIYNFFRIGFSFYQNVTFLLNDVEYNVTSYTINHLKEYTMEINVSGETYKITSTPTTLDIYSYIQVNKDDVDNLENMRFRWSSYFSSLSNTNNEFTFDDIVFTSNDYLYNKLYIKQGEYSTNHSVRYYKENGSSEIVMSGNSWTNSKYRTVDFISGNLDNSELINSLKPLGTFYDIGKGFDNDDNIKITLHNLIPRSYFELIDGGSCEVKYNIDFYLGEELYHNILYDPETDFILPATPISDNENHVFLGWYYDEELQNKFNLEDEITEDLILYGKFGTSSSGGGSIDDPDESKFKTEYIAYAAIALVGVVVVIGLVSASTKKKSGKKR